MPVFESLEPSELVGMEGEPFMATVVTRANPATITYTWTRDGLPLSNGAVGARIIARGPALNISRLERNDAGTYICQAMNNEGTTFYQLNLTVQCKPHLRRLIPNLCAIGIYTFFILHSQSLCVVLISLSDGL